MYSRIAANAPAFRRWLAKSEETLGNHSDRLNAINIFPVADGDTGTNLYLTVRSAAQAVQDLDTSDVGALLALASQAAMEQARGNSGTLFSVFLAAFAEPLAGSARISGPLLAASLQRAQIRSWSALSDPVPGTMLSVLEASATAASLVEEAQHGDDSNAALGLTLDAVVEAAAQAVVQTELQLDQLRNAQVVDAGGVGMLLVFDCLRSVILGEELQDQLLDGLSGYDVQDPHIHEDMPVAGGVEVMCTVSLSPLDAAGLRAKFDELGDSVIISPVSEVEDADGRYRWRVHVHVPEADVALELISAVGIPDNVSVTQLSGNNQASSLPGSQSEPGAMTGTSSLPGSAPTEDNLAH